MADIDFELVAATASQPDDMLLARRGTDPFDGALIPVTSFASAAQGALAATALQPGAFIPMTDVTGLIAALAGKADTGHVHSNATTGAAGFMSAADKAKLDLIAAGATANSPDATLLARANHTGTQAAATITGLATIATSGSATDLGTGTIPAARMPAHTGNVTSTAGSVALTIANDAVTNAKLANMAANTIKGNNTGASADPVDLTATQMTAMLDVFTSALKGMAPASGGGTTAFLRADGTWATPPGTGGVTDGDKGDVVVSGGGTVWNVETAGIFGVNTTANTTRRLSVQSAEALFSHDGTSHNLRINKSSGLNNAMVTFENAAIGRARAGLLGSTAFSVETSPDGVTWSPALNYDAGAGSLNIGPTVSNSHIAYKGANILGTVSQASGVPTGAVIERISNANGECTRFADGTQICWHTLMASASAAVTWNFPAAFSAQPSVNGNPIASTARFLAFDTTPTTTAVSFSIYSIAPARIAINGSLTAIGRWF